MGKKLTRDDLVEIIEREGLDYAVRWYVSPDDIQDDEIYQEWNNALCSLNSLCQKLGID